MIWYLLLPTTILLTLVAFLTIRGGSKNNYSWVQFFARGKDAGFRLREIELLRKVAVKAEMEDPTALFWSEKQLDQCIKILLTKTRLTGEERNQDTQDFLARLYEYRKKIEFEHPRYKKGITTSRSIGETQHIRILMDGVGVLKSQVQRNSDRFLSISKPKQTQLPASFSWKGRRLAVYFWRKDDAGYVFDTYVLEDTLSRNAPVLQLAHSDSLFRTQKRRSIRARTHKSAYLYLPRGEEPPEKLEIEPGLRCIIKDLSETGCAVTIGGRGQEGLRVKIQFELDGNPVVMAGLVRSSEYDEGHNRSLLHIESDQLSVTTKNRILAEVFGVRPEDAYTEAYSRLEMEEPGIAKSDNKSTVQGELLEKIGGNDE